MLEPARAKFARKGCDLLFANPIDRAGAGFGAHSNEGWLLGPGTLERRFESGGKLALAHQLLSALAELVALRSPPIQVVETPRRLSGMGDLHR